MVASAKRSLAKTVSWRIISTMMAASIVFAMTGRFDYVQTFIMLDFTFKTIVYYFHERAWSKSEWENGEEDTKIHLTREERIEKLRERVRQ